MFVSHNVVINDIRASLQNAMLIRSASRLATYISLGHRQETISVKQIKSVTGSKRNQRLSLKGLGLKKINHVVQVKNTKENLGMINKCRHLIEVTEE